MSSTEEILFGQVLGQQGVMLPQERADALARALAAQLESERAATRALEFELEPASFIRWLDGEAR